VVDPLNLDLGLTGGTSRIDSRAVGPYRITAADRGVLAKMVSDELTCLRGIGVDAKVSQTPGGRPVVSDSTPACHREIATVSEQKALGDLSRLTASCLGVDASRVRISMDFTASVSIPDAAHVRDCVDKSRRTQLEPYVAPPALLFVTDPAAGVDQTRFTLSGGNVIRIVSVTGAVLLAAILVTVLAGRRLVRPLRALADAADRGAPASVSSHDEIGHLARALNDSAERRDQAEAHHRALVSDVAHELRTPLTNIRSWLEAAQDSLAPTDAQLLALLHEEAVQLQHIIDDLGDLAAADAGTLRVHPETTYARDVLTQVAESHRTTAQAAGVSLTVSVSSLDPVVRADPVRLRQMIGNLVSNAIRYTPAGGSVTLGAQDQTITVRDTGVGIPPENLTRIFDRFWRADESRSRTTGGSGLGLAIARKLAEAHGGTIEVQSEVGAGTVFTIQLPPSQDSTTVEPTGL
jgi:two-component system sensor histidine kinase BaeS